MWSSLCNGSHLELLTHFLMLLILPPYCFLNAGLIELKSFSLLFTFFINQSCGRVCKKGDHREHRGWFSLPAIITNSDICIVLLQNFGDQSAEVCLPYLKPIHQEHILPNWRFRGSITSCCSGKEPGLLP